MTSSFQVRIHILSGQVGYIPILSLNELREKS